jgi:hypothetical protein
VHFVSLTVFLGARTEHGLPLRTTKKGFWSVGLDSCLVFLLNLLERPITVGLISLYVFPAVTTWHVLSYSKAYQRGF